MRGDQIFSLANADRTCRSAVAGADCHDARGCRPVSKPRSITTASGRDGWPIAAPIFEKLERELASDQDAIGRAKQLLEAYRVAGVKAIA